MPPVSSKRQIWAWAMYDWANSAFAVVVLSGFFPIVYRHYWGNTLSSEMITTTLAIANSLSSLLLMVGAIFLGAIADITQRQKSLLMLWASVGSAGTLAMGMVGSGQWEVALILYGVATLAFMLGNVIYDTMLVYICPSQQRERVSSLGFAVGYLGGGLLFAILSAMVFFSEQLGLSSSGEDKFAMMRYGFYATGLWWFIFSLPLFYLFKQTVTPSKGLLKKALKRFSETATLLKKHPGTLWFLLAYWLYIDGVDTIIRMAVDYGGALGFGPTDLMMALLLVQFIGFPATLFFGMMASRYGAKKLIYVAILFYVVICIVGSMIETLFDFYMLAVMIALVQGGIQAQSRALFSHLIPQENAAQFFGVYNLLGKFSVLIGPLLLSGVGALTGNPRLGLLSVAILLILGGLALRRVPERLPQTQ